MFTLETLISRVKSNDFNLSNCVLNELDYVSSIPSFFKSVVGDKNLSEENIITINNLILTLMTSKTGGYKNCLDFIVDGSLILWNYILKTFDDNQIYSLIISVYLCICKNKIKVEYLIKLYGIFFSDMRVGDIISETETFYEEKAIPYINNYNTFLGLLMSRTSESDENYDTRVLKIVNLFYKMMNNNIVKPRFLNWFSNLINSSKNFKNNFRFKEDYDKSCLTPKYLKLLYDLVCKLWSDSKKNERKAFTDISMDYLQNKKSVFKFEDICIDDTSENKFYNDIFLYYVLLCNYFYNNIDFMLEQYKKSISEMKTHYRRLILTGLETSICNRYLTSIAESICERTELEKCKDNRKLSKEMKNFQKDLSDIININLKKNKVIPELLIETNIDLINSLKIYEDFYFNYNYVNFENSVILINYESLRNPLLRHKYCFYASYYVNDNQTRNSCDLRFNFIKKILLPNLIQFYIDLEDLSEDDFYEKTFTRTNIINFINLITFNEPNIYSKQINQLSKNLDNRFIKFVNLYINDLSCFFDDTFETVRVINYIESREIFVSLNLTEREYEFFEEKKKLLALYKSLKVFLNNLDNMLSFLLVLSNESKDILMSKELGEKYCSQINYYFNEITNEKKRKLYVIKNKYDVGFQPLTFLNFLIRIIMSLFEQKDFVKYMSKDTRSFDKENIMYAIGRLWSYQYISRAEYKSVEGMAKLIQEKINQDQIDIPDEFCDPLMACEIIEPVVLPDTKIVMEKSVISRHLLTDEKNPFNREPLTMKQLEEYNTKKEVRKTINLFLERKKEWKKECLD